MFFPTPTTLLSALLLLSTSVSALPSPKPTPLSTTYTVSTNPPSTTPRPAPAPAPAPAAPAPGTPAPGTPAPGTPAPGTPAPGTPAPGTPAPAPAPGAAAPAPAAPAPAVVPAPAKNIGNWTFTIQQYKDVPNNCTIENATAIYYGEMAPHGLKSTCWHVIPAGGNGVSKGTKNCTNAFAYEIDGVNAKAGQNLVLQQHFDHYNAYGGITYMGWSNLTLYSTDYSGTKYEASVKVPIMR